MKINPVSNQAFTARIIYKCNNSKDSKKKCDELSHMPYCKGGMSCEAPVILTGQNKNEILVLTGIDALNYRECVYCCEYQGVDFPKADMYKHYSNGAQVVDTTKLIGLKRKTPFVNIRGLD